MSDHPLDEALNVDSSEEVKKIFGMSVELPEDPTMRDVVMFALKEYKNLTEEAQLLEPESKLKTLELAKQYLDLAKDTMYKQSDLEIKHKSADARISKSKPKAISASKEEEDEHDQTSVRRISRDELAAKRVGKK